MRGWACRLSQWVGKRKKGGSCKKTKEGKLVMSKDHDPNGPILRSLINSMRLEIPVGLILGKAKNFNRYTPLYVPPI